jgi:hypothetical protein
MLPSFVSFTIDWVELFPVSVAKLCIILLKKISFAVANKNKNTMHFCGANATPFLTR